jgi:hypothetical protein
MIELDELFKIVGPIILINVPNLKLLGLDDMPKWWSQSTKIVPPWWGDISHWRLSWRGRQSHLETPPIIDDVAEVIAIIAALSQLVVLSYLPMRAVVG